VRVLKVLLVTIASILSFNGLASAADATTVTGGPLTPGVAVKATVAVPGDVVTYTFAGSVGQHVTFDVSASTWTNGTLPGGAYLVLKTPSNAVFGSFSMSSGPTFGDFTLNATGTWTVVLDPNNASTGSTTFTLANDVPVQPLTRGVAVTTVIGFRGQRANYTFAGSVGQHVTFDVSASTWTNGTLPGGAYLYKSQPSNAVFGSFSMSSGPTFGDFTLNATGTWTLVLDPNNASTGNTRFTLANDVKMGTLTPGVAVTTVIGFRGQRANYTFAGSVGQHVTFDVSASTWMNGTLPGGAYLVLKTPSNAVFGSFSMSSGPTRADFTLNATGTWTLVLDPNNASTGSTTFKI
jgi:hypothetical protein